MLDEWAQVVMSCVHSLNFQATKTSGTVCNKHQHGLCLCKLNRKTRSVRTQVHTDFHQIASKHQASSLEQHHIDNTVLTETTKVRSDSVDSRVASYYEENRKLEMAEGKQILKACAK